MSAAEEMLRMDGADITFEVQRTPEAQARDGLNATISAEAMTDLTRNMTLWVMTRMLLHQTNTGLMPQTVRVTMNVEVQA